MRHNVDKAFNKKHKLYVQNKKQADEGNITKSTPAKARGRHKKKRKKKYKDGLFQGSDEAIPRSYTLPHTPATQQREVMEGNVSCTAGWLKTTRIPCRTSASVICARMLVMFHQRRYRGSKAVVRRAK